MGHCTVPQAKLWAIIHGLGLAKDRGFSQIHVESDSITVVNFINGGCLATHSCRPLVNEIIKLFPSAGGIQVSHVFREANQVADWLANYGLSLNMTCKIFEFVPDFLWNSILGDVCKTVYPHGY